MDSIGYIIYYAPYDEYVSSYSGEFDTSEFPEEYRIFNSIDEARIAVEYIAANYGLRKSDLEIEEM